MEACVPNTQVADVIHLAAVASAASAIQPLPFVDVALLAPIQIVMVQKIGRIHGYDLDSKAVLEILSTFGASIASQSILLSASKLLPFVGWAIAIPMAYAVTHAIGEVADFYFAHGRGVSSSELRRRFRSIYKQRKREHRDTMGSSTLRQRLEELIEVYRRGLITEEEFAAAKRAILDDMTDDW